MISDEMLVAAAGEVSAAMYSSIPVSEHVFSPGFEKKMSALIRRGAHPIRWQVLRYVAAVLIAAVTAFGGLYLLSPTVRAAFNSWIRTTFGSYFQYYSEDTTPPDVEYDYFLPEEFDGYTQIEAIDLGDSRLFIYSHSDGRLLQFDYIYSTSSGSAFLDVENCTHSTVAIGNCNADLYLSNDPAQTSILVWEDSATGTLFTICATESKENLIAIANKIEKAEKNKN